ncbi:MAG: DUF4302 domain-containing protein [Prevotella sp.]|jgi:hypothetical protein
MKTYRIITAALLLGSLALTTACSDEEDDLFDQSAAERLNEASEKYSNILTGGTAKWAMEYFPTNSTDKYTGRGYLMTMQFFTNSSVSIGMKNLFSNNVYREDTSMWEVITDDGPVLSFNTWNDNLHQFSTPEDIPYTTASGENEQGTGVGGDYEFIITSVSDDETEIFLKGKKRGIYDRMLQLPDTTTLESYVNDIEGFSARTFVDGAPNPQYLMINGDSMQVDSCFTGIIRLFKVGEDAVSTQTLHPFLFSKRNGNYYLRFRDAISYGGSTDSTFQQLRYDATQDIFYDEDNPNIYLTGADPYEFFNLQLSGAKNFTLNTNSDKMSESFKQIYDAAVSDLKSLTYTFNSLVLMHNTTDDTYSIRVTMKTSSHATLRLDYNITFSKGENPQVTFTLVDGTTNAANIVLDRAPDFATLLNTLCSTLNVSAGTTNFNLSTFKFTSVSDSNIWFIYNM